VSGGTKLTLMLILARARDWSVPVLLEDDLLHMQLAHVLTPNSETMRRSSVLVVTVLVGGVLAHHSREVGTVVTAAGRSVVLVR